ncbi:MFS transporter [Streptococcaceae bacterium ESL0687]|nr:MFS transporter [Streptococcaceae bacterium ESL0687]
MKKILTNKLYMVSWISDMISNFGDSLYYLALMNYVISLPHSKFAISIITISETVPLFASFFTGYLADRTADKVRKIQETLIFRIILYLFVALVMGFNPSLAIVLVASIVNFLADLAGQYENGLFTPISNRIVTPENREETMAFRQSVSNALYIGFQSASAILITFLSYQTLAFINALTFLISYLVLMTIRKSLQNILQENPIPVVQEEESKLIDNLWKQLKTSINYLFSVKEIKSTLLAIPILNGCLAIVIPLLLLLFSENNNLIIKTSAITIAILTTTEVLGGILGGIAALSIFKNANLFTILKASLYINLFLFGAIFFKNIYLIVGLIFILNILIGVVNPKMGALIYNGMPEDKLATIFGGMVTYFSLGNIIARTLFSILILFLPLNFLVFLILIFATAALITLYLTTNK